MKKIIVPLLMLSFLFTGCSCKVRDADIQGFLAGPGTTAFEAASDEPVVIKFKSRLSTGYSWKFMGTSAEGITLESESSCTIDEGIAGGEDMQIFKFKAAKGEYTLTFKYAEHWKKKPEYKETGVVKITVK